ncbi:MAG: cytochrome c family protein, partial [Planctomycetes bacterium]|nr:cytochrome c family protein [Planctomycetota bacterium]
MTIRHSMFATAAIAVIGVGVWSARAGDAPAASSAPGPFAPSRLATSTGEPIADDWGYASEDCAACHPAQHEAWKGSMHSRAHNDGLYLAFAHKAREEGGVDLYRFCSGCHAPAAVASGEIPGGKGRETTFHTDDGVGCVVCHSVNGMKELHAGGGANGSIVLGAGDVMYGPISDPAKSPAHGSEESPLHRRSEFCSNCHTLT